MFAFVLKKHRKQKIDPSKAKQATTIGNPNWGLAKRETNGRVNAATTTEPEDPPMYLNDANDVLSFIS